MVGKAENVGMNDDDILDDSRPWAMLVVVDLLEDVTSVPNVSEVTPLGC